MLDLFLPLRIGEHVGPVCAIDQVLRTKIAEQLMNDGEPLLRAHLQSVAKTGKIPEDAREDMRTLLQASDLASLYLTSPNVAPLAVAFAVSHAGELGEDIVEKVSRELLQLAEKSKSIEDLTKPMRMEDMILSAALYL